MLRFQLHISIPRCHQHPKLISSTISVSTNSLCITQDYLINSCGMCSETVLSASQKIHLKSTQNPDSVLQLLKHFGFSETQITLLISKFPTVLQMDCDKILKPKLEFYQSLGLSGPELAKHVTSDPLLLSMGTKSRLIPNLAYLKIFLASDKEVLFAFKRCTRIFKYNLEKVVGSNVAALQTLGVPKCHISKILLSYPSTLMGNTDRFSDIVDKVSEIGIDPLSMNFVHAVRIMISMTREVWEGKLKAYQEFGLSEEDALVMFRRQPNCMSISEKKIRKGLDFYINVLKWKSSDFVSRSIFPSLLLLSMEKRIIPRCAVLGILDSAGVLKKMSVKSVLAMTEKQFLMRYVTEYQDRFPGLVKGYIEKTLVFEGFGEVGVYKGV